MSMTSPTEPALGIEPWLEGQVVLILCGLIASGKSTFAEELQRHYPQFQRCNQDDLGDRRRVERLARETLARGLSVCVDRTNFNTAQRSYWIEIAREFPGTSIWVIVFDTPYNVCAARLRTRTSHPTIKTPEQGLSVLSRFATDFEQPTLHEGYDRIISLKHTDHISPVYSRSEIAAILRRVYDSSPESFAPIDNNSQPSRGRHSFRGNYFRSHPFRNNLGSNHNRGPRGRGDAPVGSLNSYPVWQSALARGNSVWRGAHAGRVSGVGTGRLEQNEIEQRQPSTGGEGSSQFVIDSEVKGNGTAQDPFTIT